MSFEKIIGNNNAKQILSRIIETNNIVNSYMFSGPDGIGKKEFSKEFSKMILCLNEVKPCKKCKSCIEFANSNNPDFKIISSDGKIKIEQIRQMQEKVYEKPIISNKKVYIIDNAENMTVEAQNCLLKTLEEPPEYTVIILITANESNIINTIKSRCMKIAFTNIEDAILKEYLEKSLQFNDIKKPMLKTFQGSIGKAIKVKEKWEMYDELNKILYRLQHDDLIDVLNNSQVMKKEKDEIEQILEYFNVYFLEKTKEEYYNSNKYLNSIKIVEDTKNRLYYNSNYDMSIDNLLIRIWEEFNN